MAAVEVVGCNCGGQVGVGYVFDRGRVDVLRVRCVYAGEGGVESLRENA